MNRLMLAVLTVVIPSGFFESWSMAQEMAGVKCVVDGDRNADEQFKVEHADGEIYFCCKGCSATFEANAADYHTRANHQLVVTGQYQQTACPVAGEDFDLAQTAKVGGVEVAFCCASCKSMIDSAADLPAKAELVFGTVAFKRAFSKSAVPVTVPLPEKEIDLSAVKCLMQSRRWVKETFSADYRDSKVYFCCSGCLKNFEAAPEKYAAKANLQLVSTHQFVQTKCPLTDGDADESKTVTVGGLQVAVCCEGCQRKIASATEDERVALVFDDPVFEKSFAKAPEVAATNTGEYSVAPEALADPGK